MANIYYYVATEWPTSLFFTYNTFETAKSMALLYRKSYNLLYNVYDLNGSLLYPVCDYYVGSTFNTSVPADSFDSALATVSASSNDNLINIYDSTGSLVSSSGIYMVGTEISGSSTICNSFLAATDLCDDLGDNYMVYDKKNTILYRRGMNEADYSAILSEVEVMRQNISKIENIIDSGLLE